MPRPLTGLEGIADRFDAYVLDQWGVLHDGARLYPGVLESLEAMANRGAKTVVLSNSGKRVAYNRERLTRFGLSDRHVGTLITSGEVLWQSFEGDVTGYLERHGRRCQLLSRGGDQSPIDGIDLVAVDAPEDADFVLLAGLDDDARIADLNPLLKRWRALELDMVCSNPDSHGVTEDGLTVNPGLLAARYAAMGGHIDYVGKPFKAVYDAVKAALDDVPNDRVLAIGDSLDHDVVGGQRAGFKTLLVTNGIHADACRSATTDKELGRRVAEIAAGHPDRTPDYVMRSLIWSP